ncbi:MAG TPA: cytochrome c biogenesis protein CcsA, partial [Blastocatellia bacterium]|nr:cytochrome c biogenesis protein CcsA [Blastocatellia bacterium]
MEILTYVIIAGYAICVAQAIYSLTTKKAVLGNFALAALLVAFVSQSVWLAQRGITTGRCPLVGTQETTAFLSWCLVVAYVVAQRWYHTASLKAFVFPLVFVLATIAAIVPGVPGTPASIQAPLPRFLLPVHVGLIMLAYSAFFISFGAGLMYIVQERELKLKRFGTVFQKLPSLDTCDAISFKSIAVGF